MGYATHMDEIDLSEFHSLCLASGASANSGLPLRGIIATVNVSSV